jgi:hypothetical protein
MGLSTRRQTTTFPFAIIEIRVAFDVCPAIEVLMARLPSGETKGTWNYVQAVFNRQKQFPRQVPT